MRALVIAEHPAPTSTRPTASPSASSSSSHGKSYASGFSPIRRRLLKHLRRCIILSFGLLLCVLFVAFFLCTVEGSMHLVGRPSLQERKFFRYHGRALMQEPEDRRHLPPSQIHVKSTPTDAILLPHVSHNETALHGLGSVYMKGTKPMPNLIIANIDESCDTLDFRVFLRTLYKSGTMSSADLVFLFPWRSLPQSLSDVLKEESASYSKLHATNVNEPSQSDSMDSLGSFEAMSERKNMNDLNSNRGRGQTFWGMNPIVQETQEQASLFDPDYGSVVGFSMSDLDPADTFSEFLTNPSSQLRRWLCYEMLLGLLRYKFRLVMLVELGGVVVLGDVFARAKRRDFLYLTLEDSTWADEATEFDYISPRSSSSLNAFRGVGKERRSNSQHRDATKRRSDCKRCSRGKQRNRNLLLHAGESQLNDISNDATDGVLMQHPPEAIISRAKQGLMEMVYGKEIWNGLEQVERQKKVISSRVILSSMRAAKGLASSMIVEIVRVALQRSSQFSFPDRAILSYLVQKSPHLLGRRVIDNLQLMENSKSKIHKVENLKPEDVLLRSQYVQDYNVLHASSFNAVQKSDHEFMQRNVTASLLILANTCLSITNASNFFPDCDSEQMQIAQTILKSRLTG